LLLDEQTRFPRELPAVLSEDLPLALLDHPSAFSLGEFSERDPDEGRARSAPGLASGQFVEELQGRFVNSDGNSLHIAYYMLNSYCPQRDLNGPTAVDAGSLYVIEANRTQLTKSSDDGRVLWRIPRFQGLTWVLADPATGGAWVGASMFDGRVGGVLRVGADGSIAEA